jgi:hypothetical protein
MNPAPPRIAECVPSARFEAPPLTVASGPVALFSSPPRIVAASPPASLAGFPAGDGREWSFGFVLSAPADGGVVVERFVAFAAADGGVFAFGFVAFPIGDGRVEPARVVGFSAADRVGDVAGFVRVAVGNGRRKSAARRSMTLASPVLALLAGGDLVCDLPVERINSLLTGERGTSPGSRDPGLDLGKELRVVVRACPRAIDPNSTARRALRSDGSADERVEMISVLARVGPLVRGRLNGSHGGDGDGARSLVGRLKGARGHVDVAREGWKV